MVRKYVSGNGFQYLFFSVIVKLKMAFLFVTLTTFCDLFSIKNRTSKKDKSFYFLKHSTVFADKSLLDTFGPHSHSYVNYTMY